MAVFLGMGENVLSAGGVPFKEAIPLRHAVICADDARDSLITLFCVTNSRPRPVGIKACIQSDPNR